MKAEVDATIAWRQLRSTIPPLRHAMKFGKCYSPVEFLWWTRRKIFALLPIAIVPVVLYEVFGQKWIAAPWSVAVLLGTATSFIVGFKNVQTYNRTGEALQVWTAITGASRHWSLIARDFPTTRESAKALVYRHVAWLTALRYQLRGSNRTWEAANSKSNSEYRRKYFTVPEREIPLEKELAKYLPESELRRLTPASNKASQLLSMQSEAIGALYSRQELAVLHHTEMQRTIKALLDQQARAEGIKDIPYPPQYATVNRLLVWCFAALLPFCMVREFDRLNDSVSGTWAGNMAWLAVPFSILISWIYVALDQVGESTESPFEGGANDVPMARICLAIEIEMKEALGESNLPRLAQPTNRIIL